MDEFEKAVDDIYEATGGIMERDKIKKELREWISRFGVPLIVAKREIISKYHGKVPNNDEKYITVEELKPGMGHVNLQVKIVSINQKTYEVDGAKKIMHYGMAGDETGVIPFTAWTLDVDLRKGDCVEIHNAYTREWQGQTKLIIGQNTRLKLMPPNSVKVKSNVKPAKIVELHPHMGLVEVVGKVISADKREVYVDDVPREIYSGTIADDTGEIPFTSWDIPVQAGDVIRITGAYVSTYRGMAQLVFDNRSTVKKEDLNIEIKSIPVQVESLEGRGGFNVLVEGVIIDVKDGSGLVYRCPECGRALNGTMCPVHGRVKPRADLRVKAILDDGTGAVMCLFNREQTEKMLGMDLDEVIEKVKENMGNTSVIMDMLEEKLFARPLRVRGNVIDEEKYGLRMFVKDFDFLDLEDISKKAESLLEELGW